MRLTVSVFLSISTIVIGYSILRTMAVRDPYVKPLLLAVSIGLLLALVAFGLTTQEVASKGLQSALISIVPEILSWTSKNWLRVSAFCIVLSFVSVAAVFLGPKSIFRIGINTRNAAYVKLNKDREAVPAGGWVILETWAPGKSWEYVANQVLCLTEDHLAWKPEIKGDYLDAGDLIAPNLIVNRKRNYDLSSNTIVGRRTLASIARLHESLEVVLPDRNVEDNLLVATWNLRLFDNGTIGHSRRLDESFYYITETISHFDIVALQEIRPKTDAIEDIIDFLGPNWGVVYSLVVGGRVGERLAFIYDRRKVRIGSTIASIVISDESQPFRAPYLVSFETLAGEIAFCNVHIVWDSGGGSTVQNRVKEIRQIGDYLADNFRGKNKWDKHIVFLGDFNSALADGPEIEALKDIGFYFDPDSVNMTTSCFSEKVYDQICILPRGNEDLSFGKVGAYSIFDSVYRDSDELEYRSEMGSDYLGIGDSDSAEGKISRSRFYHSWRTKQISDHKLKWVEFRLPN